MKIEERLHANIDVLRPLGRIDSLNSAEFQARLLAAVTSAHRGCIIDLAAVEFVSSAGLQAIATAARAKPPGAQLAVAAANRVVGEILRVSRFFHIVPIFATVGEAAAALLAPPPAPPRPLPAPLAGIEPPSAFAVRFWGTRAAPPPPMREAEVRAKICAAVAAAVAHAPATAAEIDSFVDDVLPFAVRGTYGVDTSCVEIVTGGEEPVLCDFGSGAREFGRRILAEPVAERERRYHAFLSRPDRDRLTGLALFAPAQAAGNRIRLYGCPGLEAALSQRQTPYFLPLDFGALPARIEFVPLEPGRGIEIADLSVAPLMPSAAGEACGYRFTRGGKTVVYSTDRGDDQLRPDSAGPFLDFCLDADLLILDAMAPPDATPATEDWRRSNNIAAIELAQMARVKRLVLSRHDPAHDDGMIDQLLADAIRIEELSRRSHRVEIIAAFDGLELAV